MFSLQQEEFSTTGKTSKALRTWKKSALLCAIGLIGLAAATGTFAFLASERHYAQDIITFDLGCIKEHGMSADCEVADHGHTLHDDLSMWSLGEPNDLSKAMAKFQASPMPKLRASHQQSLAHNPSSPLTQHQQKLLDGTYVEGIYLEGARWDSDLGCLMRQLPKVLIQLKREKDAADREKARQQHAKRVEELRVEARKVVSELDESMLEALSKAKFTQIAHLADAVQVFVQGFCKQSNPDAGTVAYGNKLFTMDGLLQYIQELPDQAWVIATWSDRAPTQEQAEEELEAVKAGMHGYQHPTAKGKKASDAQLEKLKPKGLQQMLDVVTRLTTLATVMNEKPA